MYSSEYQTNNYIDTQELYQHFVHRELFFRIHKFQGLVSERADGAKKAGLTSHHNTFSSDLNINIMLSALVVNYLLLNNDWAGNFTITMLSIQMLPVNFLVCMSPLFLFVLEHTEDHIIESNHNVMYLDYK